MIFDKLKTIIAQQFGVEENAVTAEMSFEDDLGADSVDLVELSMASGGGRKRSTVDGRGRDSVPWATCSSISRSAWRICEQRGHTQPKAPLRRGFFLWGNGHENAGRTPGIPV